MLEASYSGRFDISNKETTQVIHAMKQRNRDFGVGATLFPKKKYSISHQVFEVGGQQGGVAR